MKIRQIVSKFVLLLCLGTVVLAQTEEVVEVQLSLPACRELVLQQNLEVEFSRSGLKIAEFLQKAEKGDLMEPVLEGQVEKVWNERQNTTEEVVAQGVNFFKEDNNLYDVGISQPLPTGGRLRLGYNLSDLSNNLDEERGLEGTGEEYAGFFGLVLTQPLMKDGGFALAFARLRIAEEDQAVALQEIRRSLNTNLAGMEKAYWDLYIAQERVALREASIKIAEQILEDNKVRVGAGRMAEIEEGVAVAGISLRQAQHLDALQAQDQASYRLKTFFSSGIEQDGWILMAVDTPQVEPLELDVRAAREEAMELHPEMLIRQHRLEQEKVREQVAGNQRKIQLDLEAGYGYNGLGLSSSDAWDNIEDQEYPSWNVALVTRIPLGGGLRVKNELAAARERTRQGQLAVQSAEIELGNQIASSARQVSALFQQSRRYRQVVELNENLLKAELEQLEGGLSDSRKVLEAEQELFEAREAEMNTQIRYMQAQLELELVQGTFLRNRNVDPLSALSTSEGER